MPYDILFFKRVSDSTGHRPPTSSEIVSRIAPAIGQRFARVEITGEGETASLAGERRGVTVAAKAEVLDPGGQCRIHLTAYRRTLLVLKKAAEGDELEEAKRIIAGEIAEWTGSLPDTIQTPS